MLEIFLLIRFAGRLGTMAGEKNRRKAWGGLGVLLWIVGEIAGAMYGLEFATSAGSLYLMALVGACIGAVVAYLIVRNLSPLPPPDFPTARVL